MNDKKDGKVLTYFFRSIILLFVLILLVFMFFGEKINEKIKEGFTDDEQVSILYQQQENCDEGNKSIDRIIR